MKINNLNLLLADADSDSGFKNCPKIGWNSDCQTQEKYKHAIIMSQRIRSLVNLFRIWRTFFIFRFGVVICCISATVYYGGLCTEKYISNPATVTSEMVPISELPPLQMSICRQVYLSDCTSPEFNFFNFFDYDDDNGTN